MLLKYLGMMLSPLTFMICYRNLNYLKVKLKDCIIIFLVLATILLTELTFSIPISAPVTVVALFLYQKFRFKETFFKAFVISMLVMIIFFLCDCIVGLSLIKILKIPYETIKNNSMVVITLQGSVLVLAFLLSKLIGKSINKNSDVLKLKKYSKKLVLVLCINIIAAFGVMYVFIVMTNKFSIEDNIIAIITSISIVYFLSSFVAIAFYGMYVKKDTELVQKTAESKQLQEYTDMIEYLYSDMRKFKHDYVNILSTLNGYIELNEIEGLKDYIVQKLLPMGDALDKDDMRLSSLYNLNNIPLKGLLSSKLLQAQNRNMDVLVDIAEEINISDESMEVIDLCRIVGIFTDNALEAASKTGDKVVRIALVKKGESVIILVINSVEENIPPVHKMFRKGFSTKGTNRGLGLANVNNMIRKYNNITLDTYIEDGLFTQEMTINEIK